MIAAMLVVSLAFQSAGCTTIYPAQPVVAAAVPVRSGSVATHNPNQVVPAPATLRPPDVPTNEFFGSAGAGILAGVLLVGAIGLLIVAKSGGGSSGASAGPGGAP
jgi:hypothetical protein